MVKKKWRLTITVSACVLVLTLAIFGMMARNKIGEGDAYVRRVMPGLVRSWNPKDLRADLSPLVFTDADIANISSVGSRVLGSEHELQFRPPSACVRSAGNRSFAALSYAIADGTSKQSFVILVAEIDGRWQLIDFDASTADKPAERLFRPVANHPSIQITR
jgi:hypothetical protein